jgi:hypothetical protein
MISSHQQKLTCLSEDSLEFFQKIGLDDIFSDSERIP